MSGIEIGGNALCALLRERAKAAAPGPWLMYATEDKRLGRVWIVHNQERGIFRTPCADADARYLAAMQPETVIWLTKEVERLTAENARLAKKAGRLEAENARLAKEPARERGNER